VGIYMKNTRQEKCKDKHVSNKTGGVLYYMWMLPSKVMPYLLRLATPLTDSSIVHWTPMLKAICYSSTATRTLCHIQGNRVWQIGAI
jgi:hypothetical protein